MTCIDERVVTLEDKVCDSEVDLLRQKREFDKSNQAVSQQISDVEFGLAAHIETVKNNVERELVGAKQSHISLENKLTNFTIDLQNQNKELNNKMDDLRGDFEQLKTLSDRVGEISTSNSFSDRSGSGHWGSGSQNTCLNESLGSSENGYSDSFYMYGDTSRSLIIDGLYETRHENLGEILLHCINDVGVYLGPDDIEDAFRIGKNYQNRKWPRPVKLILRYQTKRDQIFIFKARLRFSTNFRDVRVNKEQRRDVRVKVAKLRQAGLTAKKMGYAVNFKQGEISIDGRLYSTQTLNEIPDIFMSEANRVKNAPINTRRLSLFEKCRTVANDYIMVGLSLQKTPYGLAFFSIQSFLSNFYKCKFFFDGRSYNSVEQGYQCTKADLYNDRPAFDEIYEMDSPAKIKQRGSEILCDEKWHKVKLQVMEDLLYEKFKQNKKLCYSLLNTRPMDLIEATLDNFWGAGCVLKSIALEEGIWQGLNHLGKLLMKTRDVFVRELEIGQGSIQ